MPKILIVEDDDSFAQMNATFLRDRGYEVRICDSFEAVSDELLKEFYPDVVILDMVLGRLGGREVIQKLTAYVSKTNSSRPSIIVVTGQDPDSWVRQELVDPAGYYKVSDFLDKGRGFPAVLETYIRRCLALGKQPNVRRQVCQIGETRLVADISKRQIMLADKKLELPDKDFAVLWHLMLNSELVVSREELIKEIWAGSGETKIVTKHVHNINRCFEDQKLGKVILSKRGEGYRFQYPVEKIQ